MNKKEKHQRAEAFRVEIANQTQRNHAISEIIAKDGWDEADKVRLTVLFQKAGYAKGCESNYRRLVQRVEESGDQSLIKKAQDFAGRL